MPEVVTADVAVTGDTDLRPGEPATSATPAEPATSTAPGEPATSTTPAEPATSAAPAEAVGAPATRALPVVPADGPITRLSDATTSQIAPRAADTLLVVPLGATEQHGPHLPLGTDTAVAHALAIALAQHRPDIVVAPELPFGASGEHADFAGTLSIGTEVTTAVLVELVRSADAFRGVVLVNAHGGNQEALAAACRQSSADGRDVLAFTPSPAMLAATAELHGARVDAHAGWVETSLMLALHAEAVRADRAAAGNCRPIQGLLGELQVGGIRAVSANGVLGDPAGSTASAGQALFEQLLFALAGSVEERWGPPSPQAGTSLGSVSASASASGSTGAMEPLSVGTTVSPSPPPPPAPPSPPPPPALDTKVSRQLPPRGPAASVRPRAEAPRSLEREQRAR